MIEKSPAGSDVGRAFHIFFQAGLRRRYRGNPEGLLAAQVLQAKSRDPFRNRNPHERCTRSAQASIQVLPNDKNPADSRSVSRIFYTFSISRRLFSAVPEESRLRLFGCALHRDLLHIVVSLSAVPGGLDLCLCLDVQQFGHNIKRNGSHRVSTSSSFLQFQLTTAPGECYGRTARK